MSTRLMIAPATFPVTLAEAKAHLRVDFDDDDALITQLITSATDDAQMFTGRAFIDQTWDLVIDAFPVSEIKIPFPPLIAVNSIKYFSSDGNETTLDASAYTVDNVSTPGWVVPSKAGWPATLDAIHAVTIQYRAGYVSGVVPGAIKAAILLRIGSLYAQRETEVVGFTTTALSAHERLLRHYRVNTAIA